MRVSLVVVSFRSSDAVARLLATAEGVDETVVVDHSEDPAEAARLRELPVDRLVVQSNRGYAAGLNRGAREATGDVLLLANPDLELAPGCVEALASRASRPGAGVVAPRLLWDREGRWQLPHATPYTWRLEWLAARLPRLARALYVRHQERIWTAATPVRVPAVGGALMATTPRALEATGGLDEGYFLYFEENDWCLRLRAAGLRVEVQPAAGAVHPYGTTTGERAGEHFSASLARYRSRHLPRWWLRRHPAPPAPGSPRLRPAARPPRPGEAVLLAHSPLAIPCARLELGADDPAPERLLPPHAHPGRHLLLARRGFRLLGEVEVGPNTGGAIARADGSRQDR